MRGKFCFTQSLAFSQYRNPLPNLCEKTIVSHPLHHQRWRSFRASSILDVMKDEIYNALAALNRGFGMILESLKALKEEGVVNEEYVQHQREVAEEFRADVNALLLNKLQTRESDDRDHFGKMRMATEAHQTRENRT